MADLRQASGGSALSRRHMVRRGISGVMATALASCGLSEPGSAGAPAAPTTPVTVDLMHRWNGTRERLVVDQVRAFEAAHPNIKVNNQMVAGSGAGFSDGMPYEKIFAMIAAGTPPDVFMVGSAVAADFASKDGLRPVDDLLKRDKLDPLKVFYPALARMGQHKGKTYGLPQLTGADVPYLFWNLDTYQAAGLDGSKSPQNWEELVEYSQKLTVREGASFARVGLQFPGSFINWLYRNGGQALSDDAAKATFDSPAGLETLQWMVDTTKRLYGSLDALTEFVKAHQQKGADGGRAPWYIGKVGLWITGVWHFFESKEESPTFNAGFRGGAGIAPHNMKKAGTKNQSIVESVWLYAIGKGSKQAAAAWEWVKFTTAGEGNKPFVLAQSRPSPVPKFNEDPVFEKQTPLWSSVVLKGLALAHPLPQTPAYPQIQRLLDALPGRVLSGQKGVREALTEAGQEAQRLLDQVPR